MLVDRPASAETIGSGGAQSKTSTFKFPYSDHVILEDTGDSSPLQGRVESTIAERSGRKVLTGTSKSISEKTTSPKVSIEAIVVLMTRSKIDALVLVQEAFSDSTQQTLSREKQNPSNLPNSDKRVRLTR